MSRGGRGAPPGCVNYGDAAVGGGMKLPGGGDARCSGSGESGLWVYGLRRMCRQAAEARQALGLRPGVHVYE